MAEMVVVAEHREGRLRDVTLQMLGKARQLGREQGHRVAAVLLCAPGGSLAAALDGLADETVVFEDDRLKDFDPEVFADVLAAFLGERRPLLALLGHTAWSMDLAPALAARTGHPLATDCVDVLLDGDAVKVVRQVYGGKMFARSAFRPAGSYLVTIRPGSSPAVDAPCRLATRTQRAMPAIAATGRRRFKGFRDGGPGGVDIAQAELLVSVGRGIGDEENIEPAREVAALLGGALSCSRPVVDKKWLPKAHQVGTSGKSVKPKVYLALGISGAFQHMAGISAAGTVIAVNKDKKAPIFRAADYGVVADAVDILDALKAQIGKI
jgi:electron transfer flavoprotein alpha subunit